MLALSSTDESWGDASVATGPIETLQLSRNRGHVSIGHQVMPDERRVADQNLSIGGDNTKKVYTIYHTPVVGQSYFFVKSP
jgi:hypothetical protein